MKLTVAFDISLGSFKTAGADVRKNSVPAGCVGIGIQGGGIHGVVRRVGFQETEFAVLVDALPDQGMNNAMVTWINRVPPKSTDSPALSPFPLLHPDAVVVKLRTHTNDLCVFGVVERQDLAQNPPFCCKPAERHLDPNPKLRKIKIVKASCQLKYQMKRKNNDLIKTRLETISAP